MTEKAAKSSVSPSKSPSASSRSANVDKSAEPKSELSVLESAASPKSSQTEKRQTWQNHIEYVFASIGYAVGFGNVWRYPSLAYENGGAAFIIPYVISVILCGMPLYALEAFLGQLSGRGVTVAHGLLAPLFQGVGWGMMFVSFLIFVLIIGWCLFFLVASFNSTLPWSTCQNDWSTRSEEKDNCCRVL